MVCFCYSRFFAHLLHCFWADGLYSRVLVTFGCEIHAQFIRFFDSFSSLRFHFDPFYRFIRLDLTPSPSLLPTAVAVADLLQFRCVLLFLHSSIHSFVRCLTLTRGLFSFINLFINFLCLERAVTHTRTVSLALSVHLSRVCLYELCVCRRASISIICIACNERVFCIPYSVCRETPTLSDKI